MPSIASVDTFRSGEVDGIEWIARIRQWPSGKPFLCDLLVTARGARRYQDIADKQDARRFETIDEVVQYAEQLVRAFDQSVPKASSVPARPAPRTQRVPVRRPPSPQSA